MILMTDVSNTVCSKCCALIWFSNFAEVQSYRCVDMTVLLHSTGILYELYDMAYVHERDDAKCVWCCDVVCIFHHVFGMLRGRFWAIQIP